MHDWRSARDDGARRAAIRRFRHPLTLRRCSPFRRSNLHAGCLGSGRSSPEVAPCTGRPSRPSAEPDAERCRATAVGLRRYPCHGSRPGGRSQVAPDHAHSAVRALAVPVRHGPPRTRKFGRVPARVAAAAPLSPQRHAVTPRNVAPAGERKRRHDQQGRRARRPASVQSPDISRSTSAGNLRRAPACECDLHDPRTLSSVAPPPSVVLTRPV